MPLMRGLRQVLPNILLIFLEAPWAGEAANLSCLYFLAKEINSLAGYAQAVGDDAVLLE